MTDPPNALEGDASRDDLRDGLTRIVSASGLERPAAPVVVRPVVDELVEPWVSDLETALRPAPGRIIAFTGDDLFGAALVASGLAAWVADRGTRVTLVDASLVAPVVAKPLREDGDEGLVDALSYGVSVESVTRRTLASGVSIVTAGSYPLDPEELIRSRALRTILEGLADDKTSVFLIVPPQAVTAIRGTFDVAAVVADDAAGLRATLGALRSAGEHMPSSIVGVLFGSAVADPRADSIITPTPPDRAPVGEVASGPAGGEAVEQPVELEETERERAAEPPSGAAEAMPRQEPIVAVAVAPAPRRGRGRAVGIWIVAIVLAASVWYVSRLWWKTEGIPETPVAVAERGAEPRETPEHEAAGPGAQAEPEAAAQERREGTEIAGVGEPPDRSRQAVMEADATDASRPPDVSSAGLALTPADLPPGDPAAPYRIYLSSHRLPSEAERELARSLGRGLGAAITKTELEASGTWYRLELAAGYRRLATARDALDMLRTFGYEGAWIEYHRHERRGG